MRQGFVFLFILMIVSITFPGKEVQSEKKYQMIPDEAIRLRILANSDDEADQALKYVVRDEVNEYIESLVEQMTTIDDARATIREKLPEIEQIVMNTIEREGAHDDVQVEYGSNIDFPEKVYGPFVYPAGEYEAVMITLGEGKGANWWCVLFPPLCYLDVSDDSSVDEESDENTDDKILEEEDDEENDSDGLDEKEDEIEEDVEVSFFLLEWLGWS